MHLKQLKKEELKKVNGGVDVGTVFGGVVTTVAGVAGVAIPEPSTTAGGYLAIGGGLTTIAAGIAD